MVAAQPGWSRMKQVSAVSGEVGVCSLLSALFRRLTSKLYYDNNIYFGIQDNLGAPSHRGHRC